MATGDRPDHPAGRQSKREKFEEAGKFPVKKTAIAAGVVIVIAVVVVVSVMALGGPSQAGGPVVSEGGGDYGDTPVEMSRLTSAQTTDAGTVTLSLAEVTDKKIGGFVYNRSTPMPAGFDFIEGNGLPVLAYVSPSGKLVVATSLCEPCRSYNFHIEGTDLVCNSCFTHWKLDTLEGVEGGCLDFPPEEITVVVNGDLIEIQQSELEAWVPRG